jgi:hypothetical protein
VVGIFILTTVQYMNSRGGFGSTHGVFTNPHGGFETRLMGELGALMADLEQQLAQQSRSS